MAALRLDDTIAAIATPVGVGAVGIVRASGPEAIAIADRIFLPKRGKPLAESATFFLRYGWIVRDKKRFKIPDPASPEFKEHVIDEVVVSVMRAPHSYTREDVVEVNSHGGTKALSVILDLFLENGVRLAQPGEFTRRAFLNGRLDLAQAEAVCDIIQAKSALALKNGMAQLGGAVSHEVKEMRSRLLDILADMEARLDFSEEEDATASPGDFSSRIGGVRGRLESLLESGFRGRIIREGLKAVITGRPNVGKSSLLNALLRRERAIVTPLAGTTRDTIEEFIDIQGVPVCLIDTAGLGTHANEIEKEALNRTQGALEEADVVLFVIDGSEPLGEEDHAFAAGLRSKNVIGVINKSDKPEKTGPEEFKKLFVKEENIAKVSALTGENIPGLEQKIFRAVFDAAPVFSEGVLVSNMRHIEALKAARASLDSGAASLQKGLSLEFAALDVKKALDALGALTGEVFSEDLLDVIFSKFCVGK